MNACNLVPIGRQLRQARRARLRRWCVILAALGTSLCSLLFAGRVLLAGPVGPTSAELGEVTAQLSTANSQTARLRVELQAVRQQIASARAISDQPDLSVLLAMLSTAVDDPIVVNRCDAILTSATPQDSASAAAVLDEQEPAALVLKLTGFGRSQAAVQGFVLNLESRGLFDKVTLEKSSRQPLFGNDAAAFQIECLMQPPRGGAR